MVKCDVVVGAIFSVSGISTSGPKSQILVNTGPSPASNRLQSPTCRALCRLYAIN